jgi:hypothetical protein
VSLAGGKRVVVKLQAELFNLLKTVAQRFQHSHLTEIGYLNQLLESTHRELSNGRLNLSPSSSADIISQEKELRKLIQEYLAANQKLNYLLNQLSSAKLGVESNTVFLKQTWQNLKLFYCQQEDRESRVVLKYKEFQRRVNNLQLK